MWSRSGGGTGSGPIRSRRSGNWSSSRRRWRESARSIGCGRVEVQRPHRRGHPRPHPLPRIQPPETGRLPQRRSEDEEPHPNRSTQHRQHRQQQQQQRGAHPPPRPCLLHHHRLNPLRSTRTTAPRDISNSHERVRLAHDDASMNGSREIETIERRWRMGDFSPFSSSPLSRCRTSVVLDPGWGQAVRINAFRNFLFASHIAHMSGRGSLCLTETLLLSLLFSLVTSSDKLAAIVNRQS